MISLLQLQCLHVWRIGLYWHVRAIIGEWWLVISASISAEKCFVQQQRSSTASYSFVSLSHDPSLLCDIYGNSITNGAGTRLHGKELNKRPIAALDCLPRRPKFSSSFPMYNIWAGSARFVSPTGMLFEMFDIFSRMLHWLFDRAHLSLSFVYVSLLSTLSSSHYPYWY